MKIYVASSWRNIHQPNVVRLLSGAAHADYDFRNPYPGNKGFHWSEIDSDWQNWTPMRYREALEHPIAIDGYLTDFTAMEWADVCVLLLPCGRSAHLEAGYFVGAGKPLHVLILDKCEPELMYKMATGIYTSIDELIRYLEKR